jgi:hypothetical protein
LEARDGIEPSVKVLQTYALPLGYRALENRATHKSYHRSSALERNPGDDVHKVGSTFNFARIKRRLRNCRDCYKIGGQSVAGGASRSTVQLCSFKIPDTLR